ncbi:uncharacterized protein LOC119381422 [Rhipicephalus sanguineus]|uniref:uncharacterized protein LOC119381422 n=1 Tax=Rhipicephalus sanguineus TaxID=34632 RepID=UPI0018937A22|nr:uncharacterized protein LOC119381422 [Rhipicephalus sanguineus]
MMALGVAPDNADELVYLPDLMMTEYLPHLFVSIAHLPSVDTSSPKCLILPPSIFVDPPGVYRAYFHTVFCSDQELSKNYLYNSKLHVSFTYSQTSGVTVTFDSERALRSKICDTKPNAVSLPYHIAAYDIDYDASWSSACVFLTLRGPYHRLKLLCKLEQLLLTGYTLADCHTRDIHMSSDNCDP